MCVCVLTGETLKNLPSWQSANIFFIRLPSERPAVAQMLDVAAILFLCHAPAWGTRSFVRPWTGYPLLLGCVGVGTCLKVLPASVLEHGAPSLWHTLLLLVLVDGLQYLVHAAAHRFALSHHVRHHRHTRPTAADAFDTGPADALVQLVVPLFVAMHVVAPNRTSLLLFGSAYAAWLQFLHTHPVDWPSLRRIGLVTPRYHHVHHQRPRKNLSHVFTTWDWLGGTRAANDDQK